VGCSGGFLTTDFTDLKDFTDGKSWRRVKSIKDNQKLADSTVDGHGCGFRISVKIL
jgi:hypothetical protein